MKEGSKERSMGCNVAHRQPNRRVQKWIAPWFVLVNLFISCSNVSVVQGRYDGASIVMGRTILAAVVVGLSQSIDACQRIHHRKETTTRRLGLESDNSVDCPLSTEIYQLKYDSTSNQYAFDISTKGIDTTIDMINNSTTKSSDAGASSGNQKDRLLTDSEQTTRYNRQEQPSKSLLNQFEVPRKTSVRYYIQQHLNSWVKRQQKSFSRSTQEIATTNANNPTSKETGINNNETTKTAYDTVASLISVRACHCSNEYPETYCLAQFDTCSVDTNDGTVKCYNARSNIKTFWPILIIWVFGVAVVFARGELARNASGFVRRKLFFLRNYREVPITIPTTPAVGNPTTNGATGNNDPPNDQQGIVEQHQNQDLWTVVERNYENDVVQVDENNSNNHDGSNQVEGPNNQAGSLVDTLMVRIRMTDEEHLYHDLLILTERDPQRVGFLYQNAMVRERVHRQRLRERRHRRRIQQQQQSQSFLSQFWERWSNPRPSQPLPPPSLPLQVSIIQQQNHQQQNQHGRFLRSSSARSLEERIQRSSSARSLPVQRASSLRSLQMQRSSSARSVQSELFQRSSSARSLQSDRLQRSLSARSLQANDRPLRISALSPLDNQLQRSSSVRFRDDEENNNQIVANQENNTSTNELAVTSRRHRLARWVRRVLGQPSLPMSNPDNARDQDTDQMSASLDTNTPRLLLKTTIYRKRHQSNLMTIYDESHNSSVSFGGNGHFLNDAPTTPRNIDAFLRTSMHSPSTLNNNNAITPAHDTNSNVASTSRGDISETVPELKPSWQTVVSSLLPAVAATATVPTSKPVTDHKTLQEMDAEVDDRIRCAICITRLEEGDVIGEIWCGHVFHKDCLKDWLRRKNRCPLCQRTEIAKFVDPTIQSNQATAPSNRANNVSNINNTSER